MEDEDLRTVRDFNRSFAVRINVFDRHALGTRYSLTEGRIIIEIGRAEGCQATEIAQGLSLDKGYLSRILARLEQQGIVERDTSPHDARAKRLNLTAQGRADYADLEKRSDQQAAALLAGLTEAQTRQAVACMETLQQLWALRDEGDCLIVDGADRLDEVRELFREYVEVEIRQRRGFDIDFQNPEGELADLPGRYAAPEGGLILALIGGEPAGCIAFRPLKEGACEIKRLYVRPTARGHHLGRTLLEHALRQARAAGYAWAYCDTDASMVEARSLYARAGFQETDAYYRNPLPGAFYFRMRLA
jgi:DNA-binding MarR family transcriptional regulator/GNAT superfamily N-acetyltransferase